MAKYIPLDILVAEIERRKKYYENLQMIKPVYESNIEDLNELLSFLDTLEVREVDNTPNIRFPHYKSIVEKVFGAGNLESFEYDEAEQLVSLAKEELLKDLEVKEVGVWKTVDNINLPQADKNKIYCVFTKDRYILATVIYNPKDEELLQWKCTEFPHNRYDMCEGDKYMQIV